MTRLSGTHLLEVKVMRGIILFVSFLLVASITGVAAEGSGEKPQSHKIFVNGLWLAYEDVGKGPPVVLVPGSLSDYRIWFNQVAPFSQHNRVIAYSRRYNWPNSAPGQGADGSIVRQVDDLSALIKGLGIAPAHIVGHSYGGSIALFLAVSHPEVVRTLVLAEPRADAVLENVPGAEADLKAFQNFGAAFQQALARGDTERAVKTLADFVAPGDTLPAEIHNMFITNIPAVKVEGRSRFTCEDARRIAAPTLVLSGERSPSGYRRTADAVAHCVVRGELVMIPGASHPMQILNPRAFNEAVLKFVVQH
jgi:pimeloyl-ACP methyl ester carboxylesterase